MESVTPSKLKLLKPVNLLLSAVYHTEKIDTPIDFKNVKKILVLDPTAIGDTVMLIPFLKVLKQNFTNASITLVCQKHAKFILNNLSLVDDFIIFKGNDCFLGIKNIIKSLDHLKETIKIVNKNEYDIAIEPRGDIRYLYFMHYMHARRKISYSYSGGECFLTDVFNMPKNYKDTHIIEDKLNLLKMIGCSFSEADKYPYMIKDSYLKDSFIKEHNLDGQLIVGIHPGASKKIRQYPYYGDIIKNIDRYDVFYIVFKGYNEDEAVKKIEEVLKTLDKKYIVLSESLEMYIKYVSICDLMMCNDSGAGHLSGAYGIVTYVFFGPERPAGIRPYNSENVRYINRDLECKPCYKLECPLKEQYCFTEINTKSVAKKIDEDLSLLKENKKRG